MTTNSTPAAQSYGLLRAAEAITNWRALVMCGIAAVTTFVAGSLTVYVSMHSLFFGFLLGVLTYLVFLIGYSAVGITLMRHAQGQQIGFVDAILQSAFSIHRFLAVTVLLWLAYLAIALGALVVFLLCKIPGLGPLLYAFAFPIVAVLIGLTFVGMLYVAGPMMAPSIWEGNDTFQTIARLFQIARQRLMSIVVSMFLLTILVGFLSFVVFFILGFGAMAATGLSTTVGVGPGAGLMGMLSMFGMRNMGMGMGMMDMDGYGAASHMMAFSFGAGLLFAIGMIIPMLTAINGICLIYLQTTGGMDFSGAEEKLRQKMDAAKRKAAETRDRASERMREAKEAAQAAAERSTAKVAPTAESTAATSVPAVAATPTLLERSCSNCHTKLTVNDVFCGECGTKNPI